MASPFVSSCKNRIGAKSTIILGWLITILSSVGFGFLSLLKDGNVFAYCGMGLRAMQGLGECLVQVTC